MQIGDKATVLYDTDAPGKIFLASGEVVTIIGDYSDDDDLTFRVRTFDGKITDVADADLARLP